MKVNITAVAVFTLSGAVLAQPFVDRIGKYPSKQQATNACLDWMYEENAPTYKYKGRTTMQARSCVDDSIDPPNRRRSKGRGLTGYEEPTLSGNKVIVGFEPYPEKVKKEKGLEFVYGCKWESKCKAVRYFRW